MLNGVYTLEMYVYTTIRSHTILYDETTASYSYDEMLTSLLRVVRMKNRCDRAPFIPFRTGGLHRFFFKVRNDMRFLVVCDSWTRGGGLHRMAETIWAIYRLFLKDEISIEINAKFRPCRQFRPFSAKTARAKALKLYIKFLRLGLA